MKNTANRQWLDDYHRVGRAIRFIENNAAEQPSLDRIAESVHLSKFHFQKLFKRWAGVSPTQFLQAITLRAVKERLDASRGLLEVALDAGLSGPGRLHDLFVTFEAMTPGEYKRQGEGLAIRYGIHPSPFGECLLATTERGICCLSFLEGPEDNEALDYLRRHWRKAELIRDDASGQETVAEIFRTDRKQSDKPFHLLVKGTNFQIAVWRALLNIPRGKVVTYSDVAAYLGKPSAYRAVATAVGFNPISYLIPCHRVISNNGHMAGYRWGITRKQAVLGREFTSDQIASNY